MFDTVRPILYRHRRRMIPVLPSTASSITLSAPWDSTLQNERFLLFDNESERRLLIFGSRRHLELLASSTKIMGDGTFYAAPNHFTQMYTLHGKKFGHFFPLVYGFLPDKAETTYITFFQKVKDALTENSFEIHCEKMILDFENAAHSAVQTVFPSIQRKGCTFHFGQCLWRKLQQFHLATVSLT